MTDQVCGHTPGPWHNSGQIDRTYNGEWIRAGNTRTGDLVAVCADFNRYDRDAEREANARLIAAAPEMLAALIAAEHTIAVFAPTPSPTHNQVRAAIVRATGEPIRE